MATPKKTPKKNDPAPRANPGRGAEPIAKDLDAIAFGTTEAFAAWLSRHHASSPGLWLKLAKKGSGAASITYAEALEVALLWGWIDGQKGKIDDAWWKQRFTRRGPKSLWSKINRHKAEALIASGAMEAPGLVEVERAKADGRWDDAYASSSKITVPPDLEAAFVAEPRAAQFFATLNAANRYAVLFRVHTAKKAETRKARIEKLVAMLARHEKIHA